MGKTFRSLVLAALTAGTLSMAAPALTADAAAAQAAHYSVATTLVGKLLDDPHRPYCRN
jgi:hypothetical protein